MLLDHHIHRAHNRDDGENEEKKSRPCYPNRATKKPVINRFSSAAGNKNFQAKPIS